MALLQTVLTDGDGAGPRWRDLAARDVARSGATSRDLYDLKHWSERTVIALVMQSLDNSITTYTKRSRVTGRRVLTSQAGPRRAQPDLDPGRPTRPCGRMARDHGRLRRAAPIGEPFDMPLTAHFIGGCAIGDSPDDRRGRPLPAGLRPPRPARRRRLGGLRQPRRQPVADDHRPGRAGDGVLAQQGRGRPAARDLGAAYVPVDPVAPARTRSCPDDAPGALRLPIVEVSADRTRSRPSYGGP